MVATCVAPAAALALPMLLSFLLQIISFFTADKVAKERERDGERGRERERGESGRQQNYEKRR